jgi:prevent-host-death family protein
MVSVRRVKHMRRACDYNGYMVKTLRESKAKLSELVERANLGEDVLITVRGRVKARLTRAEAQPAAAVGRLWAEELRELQQSVTGRRKMRLTTDAMLAQDREDRS